MKKTNAAKERQVVTLIVLNERYADISNQTGVPVPTIKKIKKRNESAIAELKRRAFETQAQQISNIVSKANASIEAQLDQSEINDQKLTELLQRYYNCDISRKEFMAGKRGLKPLTLNQLVSIMKTMQRQLVIEQKI